MEKYRVYLVVPHAEWEGVEASSHYEAMRKCSEFYPRKFNPDGFFSWVAEDSDGNVRSWDELEDLNDKEE